MGANAATKTYRIVQNLRTILGIELMSAAQAMEFRRPARSSSKMEKVLVQFRTRVPFIDQDRILYPLIQASADFINEFPAGEF
jgi:histidine ammonia-lyase